MQNDIVRQPPQAKVETGVSDQPAQPGEATESAQKIDVVHLQSQEGSPEPPATEQSSQQPETVVNTEPEQEKHPAVSEAPKISHKSTKPVGVIVAAVLICTGLAGGAIYAGMQNSSPGNGVATNKPAVTPAAVSPANDAAQEVDAAITDTNNLQDSAQDLSTDMSDASLGL